MDSSDTSLNALSTSEEVGMKSVRWLFGSPRLAPGSLCQLTFKTVLVCLGGVIGCGCCPIFGNLSALGAVVICAMTVVAVALVLDVPSTHVY